jgi:hypothetical protein
MATVCLALMLRLPALMLLPAHVLAVVVVFSVCLVSIKLTRLIWSFSKVAPSDEIVWSWGQIKKLEKQWLMMALSI